MGESAAEKVREIEETRGRLEYELRELEDRLPDAARRAKRMAGLAVGGGVGSTLVLLGVRRIRRRRKERRARRVAAVVPAPVLQVVPPEWVRALDRALEDGRWRPWVTAGASVWLLAKLAELRQMRRLNRALLAR
jgi:Protein of unknown function (DUF3618)